MKPEDPEELGLVDYWMTLGSANLNSVLERKLPPGGPVAVGVLEGEMAFQSESFLVSPGAKWNGKHGPICPSG